ncbi:hypothetical protein ACFE33_14105 [Falsihalocynthiibacter sp. SS001]
MKILLPIALIVTLSACGVDGEPTPPAETPETGVSISGDIRMGVAKKL